MTLPGFMRRKLRRNGKEASFVSVNMAFQQSYDVLGSGHILELFAGQLIGAKTP
ncbi:hypothetical protein FHS20_003821 [Phyllobacterium endophyticum]|nr:hypothetical protein [Phyllobacterium endophyticum]